PLLRHPVHHLPLNSILPFSVPVHSTLHPITITLLLILIAQRSVPFSTAGLQITAPVVTPIASLCLIGSQIKLAGLHALINFLPLSGASLPWLIPAILCILLSLVLPDKIKSESFEME
ncbi:branched-chain amino acid transport system II carrier protein, partial [Klebsiella pneumoniae]|nr:branched-chain amino acid transport system II carrier protein [Klebsiella pneumoniae]